MSEEKGWLARKKQAAKDFWQWLKELFKERHDPYRRQKPQQQPQPQASDTPADGEGERYHVDDADGSQVHSTDDLSEALDAWRQLTDQQGSITDTQSGEDITPAPDDNGRYAVLDENGEQVGTYDELKTAEDAWRHLTGKEGSIIDTESKQDVTPYEGHLTDEEIQEAVDMVMQIMARQGRRAGRNLTMFDHSVDLNIVRMLIDRINSLRLPIFELSNVQGSGFDVPTKQVTVTKREAQVVRKDVPYYENVPVAPVGSTWVESPTPQDDREVRPIRTFGEVARVSPLDLASPLFDERFARKQLPVRQYQVEEPGEVKTVRVRKIREEDTIVPREWEETIEVTDEQRVQSLAIICDGSGSMFMDGFGYFDDVSGNVRNIEMAVALIVVLVTKHLHDESRYSFRWFAERVDHGQVQAENEYEKRELIGFVTDCRPTSNIGGGTAIQAAIDAAADDVRKMSRQGEIQEVLLITDGEDDQLTAEGVYRALGTDVVLHTIVLSGSNFQLERHSTTYDTINVRDVGYEDPFRSRFNPDRW